VALSAYAIGGFYGVAIASLGMTSVTPTVLIMQILRPLASNAHKISRLADDSNQRGSNLKGLNHLTGTISALGNGFVSSASIMTAVSLLSAVIFLIQSNIQRLFLLDVHIIAGVLLAFAVFMLFSRSLLKSLVHIVKLIVSETTRQLRDVAFLVADKARPDMVAAADKSAIYIMKAMVYPTSLLLAMPIISGYFLGVPFLFGYSVGAFLCVFLFVFQWSVFGDSASQSKRFISNGQFGGAESKNFETITISDNIGDGMKDLLNPSANTFLKVTGMMVLLILYFLI
jgi:K(+)-stimulated pyrophosphate-energized sodium pump